MVVTAETFITFFAVSGMTCGPLFDDFWPFSTVLKEPRFKKSGMGHAPPPPPPDPTPDMA